MTNQRTTNQGTSCFVKSLPWPIKTNGSNISFFAISFYLFFEILSVKMSRVNKAYESHLNYLQINELA